MLNAINNLSWARFKELEREFVNQHGIEVWEDLFNFPVLLALDKESDKWFLIQKCSTGIKSVKVVS